MNLREEQWIEIGRSFPPLLEVLSRPEGRMAFVCAINAILASRLAADESAKSGVDTTAIMERIPTVARLYYTGLTTRRYRRASVHTGPGEPLVYRSNVERELRHIDWELRNPPEPAPVASKEAVTLNDEPKRVFVLPLTVASIINGAFLPANPNKMRGAHPDVVDAAKIFKQTLDAAITRDSLAQRDASKAEPKS